MNTLIIFFIFVPILAFILLALNLFLATHKPYESKVSAYECGFSPIYGQTRSTFQIHFYIVAMLFLIFDLEILLIFPAAVTLYQISTFGFVMLIVFFLVLTIGFILEIGTGAISLSSIESSNKNFNSKLTPYSSLQTINNKSFYNKIKFQFQHRASLSTLAINNNNEKIDF
jgi:NADH-ubiquinone oxidoreductase chain 3